MSDFTHPYLAEFQLVRGIRWGYTGDNRMPMTRRYAWSCLSEEAVRLAVQQGPLLSLGAGNGYNEWLLQREGGDVIATDVAPPRVADDIDEGGWYWKTRDDMPTYKKEWAEVQHLDALSAVRKYPSRNLLYIWPCYQPEGDWDAEALVESQCERVVFIGEGWMGCTGGELFHELLEDCFTKVKEASVHQWQGIHDYMRVYVRK